MDPGIRIRVEERDVTVALTSESSPLTHSGTGDGSGSCPAIGQRREMDEVVLKCYTMISGSINSENLHLALGFKNNAPLWTSKPVELMATRQVEVLLFIA